MKVTDGVARMTLEMMNCSSGMTSIESPATKPVRPYRLYNPSKGKLKNGKAVRSRIKSMGK